MTCPALKACRIIPHPEYDAAKNSIDCYRLAIAWKRREFLKKGLDRKP